jgi:hypothetical protein
MAMWISPAKHMQCWIPPLDFFEREEYIIYSLERCGLDNPPPFFVDP